jgi:hypothetical protein
MCRARLDGKRGSKGVVNVKWTENEEEDEVKIGYRGDHAVAKQEAGEVLKEVLDLWLNGNLIVGGMPCV